MRADLPPACRGIVQAALSVVWSIEDGATWQPAAACCTMLAGLLRHGRR